MFSQLFFIKCSTGCSCCSDENHLRGPYLTEGEASRRICHFKTVGNYHPLASQYAKRGRYDLLTVTDIETLPDGRMIFGGTRVHTPDEMQPIHIDGDGALEHGQTEQDEYFCNSEWDGLY